MGYQALLFCPDEKLARVVTQVLSDLEFSVETATEPFAAVKKLMAQHFDAVVVDCDNEQNATLLFKSARNSSSNQSSLAVAVVEGQAGVAKAFRIGANLVLTKPINVEQAKGTLRVARGLLRKATDPKASSLPKTDASQRPVAPVQQPAFKPKAPSFTPPPPAPRMPLELEREPEPALDASDAAMLESLPEPVAPTAESTPSKDFAWQAPKNASGPMAAALQRAAEAAGKKFDVPVAPKQTVTQAPIQASSVASSGAAAAPAKARELFESTASPVVRPEEPTVSSRTYSEPENSAPSFGAFLTEDDEEQEPKSKKPYFIVAAIIVAGGMAFYGWNTKQSSSSPAPAPTQTVAPVTAQPTETAPAPAPVVSSVPTQINSVPATESEQPEHRSAANSAKPNPASKNTVVAEDTVTRVAPLVVKSGASQGQKAEASSEPSPQAPGALSIASSSTDQNALNSLVASTPVAVPGRSQQTLRISQGVSQGLILKRVQPVYPSSAMQMRIQGAVQLLATISKEGRISNLTVLSGDGVLARAASDAVRQWKYKPYYLNGEPVEIQTQITVNFKLPN
jgi:periplasmic protein TonB